jgi:hypothetical protein
MPLPGSAIGTECQMVSRATGKIQSLPMQATSWSYTAYVPSLPSTSSAVKHLAKVSLLDRHTESFPARTVCLEGYTYPTTSGVPLACCISIALRGSCHTKMSGPHAPAYVPETNVRHKSRSHYRRLGIGYMFAVALTKPCVPVFWTIPERVLGPSVWPHAGTCVPDCD